jgi:TonB-linked SusC/RagA family outer membrane protein
MRKLSLLLTMLMAGASLLYSQQQVISGYVIGPDGNPIPFATVQSNDINKVAVKTDENGRFRISVPAGAKLSISSIGYDGKEVEVGSQSFLSITLNTNAQSIGSVVVTALGIVRQEKALGYSTAQVKARDLVQARPINVANGLTGKVSGLEVSTVNNGIFAPTRVTLRGNRSLTGNNESLIIVDGSIYYNDIANLNPDDIESISVLKGSGAAAIYGSDASNGVLIITTKKGILGKPVINFSSTVQLETISYMPALQNQFGSNGGETIFYDYNNLTQYVPYENQQFGPQYNGRMVPLGRPVADGSLLMVPYSAIKNSKRDFFNTGITTQNNISFSAGDEKTRFFLSAQDVQTKGVMPKDFGSRDVFRAGGSRIDGIFSANYTLTYTNKYTNTTNTGNVYNAVLNVAQHVPLESLKDWRNNKFADPSGYYNDFGDNPYFDIDNYRNKTTTNELTGNVQLNLKPVSWLNLTYRASVNNSNSRFESTGGAINYNTHAQTSDTVIYSNYGGTGLDTVLESPKYNAQGAQQATYSTSTYSNFLFTSDFIATFTKDLHKDVNLSVTAGTSYITNTINTLLVNAGPLFFPVYNINSLTGIPGLAQSNHQARKLGYFGDATIGYKSFVFLHGSYRTDIDSRLSKANRYIPYYDIDGSLVLSDIIPSIANSRSLDYLKLRAAHSLTGNASALAGGSAYIADGAYATDPTLASAPGFPFSGLGGFLLNSVIANPNIKPEVINENEAGIEMGLFHDRVSVVADVYQQKLKDGIVFAQTARSSGFTSSLINAASTVTKGLEIELKTTIIRSKKVTWNMGVNYTHIKSKVLSINGDVPSIQIGPSTSNSYAVVGQPYPVIETGDWTRDPQGHVIVDPITGNPALDPNLKIAGNANPTDLLGLTTSVTWRNFTFSATVDYRGGYKIFNSLGQTEDFTGISATSVLTGRERFVFPNSVIDEGGGKYVKNTTVTTDDADYNFWGGSYLNVGSNYVTSGSVWKLREVVIRYDFPKNWLAGVKSIQDISFTLSGRNLLMIRPKTNVWTDPEFSEGNSNAVGTNSVNQSPPTRIFSATLAIKF